MNWLKNWVMDMLIKKYCLGWAVTFWSKATGYRTQMGLAAAALVLLCGFFGVIEWDKAVEMATALGGVAIATFLEKLKGYQSTILAARQTIEDAAGPQSK